MGSARWEKRKAGKIRGDSAAFGRHLGSPRAQPSLPYSRPASSLPSLPAQMMPVAKTWGTQSRLDGSYDEDAQAHSLAEPLYWPFAAPSLEEVIDRDERKIKAAGYVPPWSRPSPYPIRSTARYIPAACFPISCQYLSQCFIDI